MDSKAVREELIWGREEGPCSPHQAEDPQSLLPCPEQSHRLEPCSNRALVLFSEAGQCAWQRGPSIASFLLPEISCSRLFVLSLAKRAAHSLSVGSIL